MAKTPVKDPADPGPDTTLHLIYAGFAIFGTLWVSVQLGNMLSNPRQKMPINPISIVVNMIKGELHWPGWAGVIIAVIVLLGVGWQLLKRRRKANASKGRLAVDDKADFMGSGGAIKSLKAAGVAEKAEQLGVHLEKHAFTGELYVPSSLMQPGEVVVPGVPIGVSVADGEMLYGSYEDLHVDIWGPRQGKTTSRVIPAILSSIGATLVTSNKRDVVDATRDVRAAKGSPIFIFDPQDIAVDFNYPADPARSWFWDPLAWVDIHSEGCEARAARLAGHFADAESGSGSAQVSSDSFFDQEAEDLLAGLFLAACVAGESITKIWDWVTRPFDGFPVEVLRPSPDVEEGSPGDRWSFMRSGLAAQYNVDPRTRSGVFGTAKKMVRCLQLSNVHPWVRGGPGRVRFDELDFIHRNGTLYSLSLEGRGSAAPLVSALSEAVIDVAMRSAARSRGGRLPIPLLAVLDEAANVVRWRDLPKQYSHFGSRGIVVMTVLQSWAQGARCWGVDGMEALWGAANIKVLGSGVDDIRFLQERSEVIGDYDSISQSVSESSGGKSYSRSLGSSRTFNANALATLPRGRAIVFSSATPAVLVRTVPWWEGEYETEVRNSIIKHEPQNPNRMRTTVEDLIAEQRQKQRLTLPTSEKQGPTESGTIEEVTPL
ncbi:type IV secretory system conjugative DNA transfer family protein [Nocardia sp. NPDC059240]|uniref:type IV secretory system conjugative DNA transfer family protein n=1 Tax=Nocardia sp. NPDC059240 TaxID=3346786 RepID=UPI00369AA9A4